jgi:hypothetical protein
MSISEEEARKMLEERDLQFNSVKEVGEVQSLPTSNVPPPKPKVKAPEPVVNQEPLADVSNSNVTAQNIKPVHNNFDIGWYEVPMDSLPSQGLFYPDGSRLLIKPASVSTIRHFSTVDDTNPLELNEAFDYILENLVRFNVPNLPPSYKNLKDIDKLSVILHIRDATFKNGESKIVSDIRCSCGNVDHKTLNWYDFEFFEFNEELMKYYNPELKVFHIKFNTESDSDIALTIPSIGIRNFIQKYVTNKVRQKKTYDKAFANIAPFIMDNWMTINDNMYENEIENSSDWSTLQFAGFVRIVDMIKRCMVSRIKHKCSKCGAEVTAPSSFRGGIKSLFIPDLQSITR